MTTTQRAFERSLERLGVSYSRTTAAGFTDHVAGLVDPPAVGVDLRCDDRLTLPASVTVDPTPAELRAARTGLTAATLGVGDYGSLALEMDDRGSELVGLFVERHVVVLPESAVLAEMDDAIDRLDADLTERRTSVVLATGPSATADMGALVKGAHGPREVHLVLVED